MPGRGPAKTSSPLRLHLLSLPCSPPEGIVPAARRRYIGLIMDIPAPVTMAAYGQTWHFTSAALAVLKPFGMGAPATLTNLIIQLSPTDGFQDGDYYEVDYQGAGLTLSVQGDSVTVDALKTPEVKPST